MNQAEATTPETGAQRSGFSLSPGWEFEILKSQPFGAIAVKTPFGRLAVVSSMARHPENILYELCKEIADQQNGTINAA